MGTLTKRLSKLENRESSAEDRVTVIHHQFVDPSPNGPIPTSKSFKVIGGNAFHSEDCQSDHQLLNAVNKEHICVYGFPMEQEIDLKNNQDISRGANG